MDTFVSLKPPPGIWRNGSRYEAKGRWYDGNLIRWLNGRLRPVGGWQRFSLTALATPVRGLQAWRANNQARWLALGASDGLFVHDGSTLLNITPSGFNAGRGNSVYGLGWGAGKYGLEAYGTARSSTGIVLDATSWSMDNFGEVLLGVASGDGRLYEWTPSQFASPAPGHLATAVTNAPLGNASMFVTEERHVVCLGAGGNPRKVQWSSREHRTLWTAASDNTAGSLDVTTPGKLLRGVRYRGESLIFTDTELHLMRFVGSPLVYGISQVGEANGLIGPQAVVTLGDQVVWMGANSFWSYDGVVRQIPCDVAEYVFQDINVLQGAKVVGGHNGEFGEVWWFYPKASSLENDRYVIWNYRENWWSFGQLARTAWVDKGVWPHPIGCSPDGQLYQHEQGWTDNGADRYPSIFAETGAMDLGNGERFTEVRQLIPDDCSDDGCLKLTFALRVNPQSTPYRTAGPYEFTQANGYCDARFAARQVDMKVAPTKDADFHFGVVRADVRPGSGR
jgi:hypothetical protein